MLKTAGDPVKISLAADRSTITAGRQDLSYVTVELADANGTRDPRAENLVRFELEGPGEIIGVGNAHPMSLESYTAPQRKAWQGRCLVVIRSGKEPGTIRLKALSGGLPGETLEIRSVAP